MKPFYWAGTKNFGDYLNTWLWPKLIPECLSDDDGVRLVGIGSLLKGSLNYLSGTKVVFGTGSGYGAIPPRSEYADWLFYFVRGPLTARCYGLETRKAIVDGAWLISLLPEFKQNSSKSGVAFVPHWTTADAGNWSAVCDEAGIKYIDPQGDLEDILRELSCCELVLTESLHGAILSDLYRTPWIPARISPKFLPFKWLDWYRSIDLDPVMHNLPKSDLFEYLISGDSYRRRSYDVAGYPIREETESLPEESTRPSGKLYAKKIALKRQLRAGKKATIESCLSLRNVWPLSEVNRSHRSRLIGSLRQLANQKPNLSSEATHRRKIQELGEVLTALRDDYSRRALGRSLDL